MARENMRGKKRESPPEEAAMNIPVYHIDAFTGKVFSGNPAAVCPLNEWLNDSLLQAIAHENNLSETAFFVPVEGGFHIRWFSPVTEVDLCGHATLATAFVIFSHLSGSFQAPASGKEIVFFSKSGELKVTMQNQDLKQGVNQGLLSMDFPSQPPRALAARHRIYWKGCWEDCRKDQRENYQNNYWKKPSEEDWKCCPRQRIILSYSQMRVISEA